MVSIYATLIINGRRTFDSVPKKLQAKVEAELKNRGYGTDGQPLPVEVETDGQPLPVEVETKEA